MGDGTKLFPLSGIEFRFFGSSYPSRLAITAYFFSYFTTLHRPLRISGAECGILSLHFSITLHQLCKLLNSEWMYDEQISFTEFIHLCLNIQNTYLHGSAQHNCVLFNSYMFQSNNAVVKYAVGSKSFRPDQLFKVTEIKQLCYFST